MKHTSGNEAAFARPYSEQQPGDRREFCYAQEGMTMREWYAGQALALISNSYLPELFRKGFSPSKAAEIAFQIADALITESQKGGGS